MNVSTFLAYDQPTISYCGVHHELLSHKSFETNAQEDTMETHLEAELDLSTITAAGRVSDHKQPLAWLRWVAAQSCRQTVWPQGQNEEDLFIVDSKNNTTPC